MTDTSNSGDSDTSNTARGAEPESRIRNSPPAGTATDARQALRLRRVMMAAASSMLMPVVLAIAAALGMAEFSVAAWSALLVAGLSLAFFAVFRSGLNLRFRDPSMSMEISLAAILATAVVAYWADGAQGPLEMFYVMVLIFASLRLRASRLLALAATALAAHGIMLYAWHRSHAGADVATSLVDFAALAIVLPWFAAMGAYVNNLRMRLSETNRRLTLALDRIESIAVRDELTGLYNRRFLMDVLGRETAGARRSGRPFAVCLLDIDHFKSVNDTFGHAAGDAVLRHFASVAGSGKRSADIFGRLGGEEFLLVMPDTGLAGALACAERVRAAVAASPFPDIPADRRITVTAGIALARDGEDESALLARADESLYMGKHAGRDRVVAA